MPAEPATLSELAALVQGRVVDRGGNGTDTVVDDLVHDSRAAGPGIGFVAIPGFRVDGHEFAPAALAAGAAALVLERELDLDCPQLLVASTREALGPLASRLWGHPSRHLALAGVTGTNGKTTITYLLESIAHSAGLGAGVVGTTGARVLGVQLPLERTTPEADDLQRLLARMVDAGVEVAAVEVSSHALTLSRVEGVRFAVAAFTNLTQDHLDFHGGMEEYFLAKLRLFDPERSERAVVWVDDVYGARVAGSVRIPVSTVALGSDATVTAASVEESWEGIRFSLVVPEGRVEVSLPLCGRFNLANALVAAAAARELGIDLATVASGLSTVLPVPGRFERVVAGQPFEVVVDYAHTPAGIEAAIAAARPLASGRVVVVVGAGGDRDRAKRPLMGAAAAQADVAVITSDNPRSEDPERIIRQVTSGASGTAAVVLVEPDRRTAIRLALQDAGPGDAVLILGKGHESGQEVDGVIHPFDDQQVAGEEIAGLGRTRDPAPSGEGGVA